MIVTCMTVDYGPGLVLSSHSGANAWNEIPVRLCVSRGTWTYHVASLSFSVCACKLDHNS